MQNKLANLEKEYAIEWREYKVGDLFKVRKGKRLPERVLEDTSGEIALINQSTQNNMLARYSGLQGSNEIYQGNAITFGVNTKGFGYQVGDFYTIADVLFLKSDFLNSKIANYMISIISKSLPLDGWDKIFGLEKMKKLLIQLPTQNGEIAFDYMEEFIKTLEAERLQTLEAERLQTLEAYLMTTGLKDYQLTKAEAESLERLEEGLDWKEFKLEKLFNIETPKKKFNANTLTFDGVYPYVARGESNNGIRGYINQDKKYLNNKNTISFGQDTATMFYQKDEYFTGDKIKIISAKDKIKLDKLKALFYISAMKKSFSTFSWGSSSFNVKILNDTKIKLPLKNRVKSGSEIDIEDIDFNFMTTLIQALQKVVIQEVVKWTDRKIKATEEIINHKSKELK